jgi:hypothetical protein
VDDIFQSKWQHNIAPGGSITLRWVAELIAVSILRNPSEDRKRSQQDFPARTKPALASLGQFFFLILRS